MKLSKAELAKISKLKKTPVRDLTKYKYVMKYIAKHGVVISMTTSPERLRNSAFVIQNALESPFIKTFYVVLPDKYRNKEKYSKKDIKYISSLDPRIKIKRIRKDIGPISKMLPVLSSTRDPKRIVISLDDDIYHAPSLINELIYNSIRYPYMVHGGAGFSFGNLEGIIERQYWPETKPAFPRLDVIEGWGGIAYRKELVDIKMLKKLAHLSLECKLSDDIVISFMLSYHGIPRKLISNSYYNGNEDLFPLSYGLTGGALHKGSGFKEKIEVDEHTDVNMVKYSKCIKQIESIMKV
jgi:hypothetical protein